MSLPRDQREGSIPSVDSRVLEYLDGMSQALLENQQEPGEIIESSEEELRDQAIQSLPGRSFSPQSENSTYHRNDYLRRNPVRATRTVSFPAAVDDQVIQPISEHPATVGVEPPSCEPTVVGNGVTEPTVNQPVGAQTVRSEIRSLIGPAHCQARNGGLGTNQHRSSSRSPRQRPRSSRRRTRSRSPRRRTRSRTPCRRTPLPPPLQPDRPISVISRNFTSELAH